MDVVIADLGRWDKPFTQREIFFFVSETILGQITFLLFLVFISIFEINFLFLVLGCLVLQDTVPLVRKLFRLLRWWWELGRMFIIWNVLLVKNVDIDFVSEISSFFMTTRFFVVLIMRREWSLLHFQAIQQLKWQLSSTMITDTFL